MGRAESTYGQRPLRVRRSRGCELASSLVGNLGCFFGGGFVLLELGYGAVRGVCCGGGEEEEEGVEEGEEGWEGEERHCVRRAFNWGIVWASRGRWRRLTGGERGELNTVS